MCVSQVSQKPVVVEVEDEEEEEEQREFEEQLQQWRKPEVRLTLVSPVIHVKHLHFVGLKFREFCKFRSVHEIFSLKIVGVAY